MFLLIYNIDQMIWIVMPILSQRLAASVVGARFVASRHG